MQDVAGQVMLAGGDKDLGTADRINTVGRGHGPGADETEVSATLRLGEAHRAAPLAAREARQAVALKGLGGVGGERLVGMSGKTRISTEGDTSGADHLDDDHVQRLRQALPAMGRIAGKAGPAAGGKGGVGLLETGGRSDDAVLEAAPLAIAD